MKIYNTLTKKIEKFIPHEEGKVKIYTCGPTVYHYAHIGNMRTYINEDILVRTLKYLGYDVTRAMNITDVGHLTSDADFGDDKMVKASIASKKSVLEIAKFYTDEFFKDFYLVNNLRPDIISPATDNISEYIKIIEKLIETGYAYFSSGNVYFDTSKLENYYVLKNQNSEDLNIGVRDTVTEDGAKRNKTDFVLWFTKSKFQDQELKWESPWGLGYPGWHIECSGISIKYLGEYLDIHAGGVDNIFPHHTNEIAQSEAYLGHKWCSYWMHGEHLNDKDGKMSKSKGGTLSVSVLKNEGYNPLSFRFMCLNSHYRSQLVFSFDSLKSMENAYLKLKNRVLDLKEDGDVILDKFNFYNDKFKECISDDLNTANALTVLYDVLKDNEVNDTTKIKLIKSFDEVFALNLFEKEVHEKDEYIKEQIEKRNEAKKAKDYALADKIRDELNDMGVELLDTKEGTTYRMKG